MKHLILLLLFFTSFGVQAQKKWTLADCIAYAREQNIQVKKLEVATQSSELDNAQSKAALFPSLSGSISQGYNRSKSASNDYEYRGLFSGSYGLNLNWTLYNGMRNLNNIKLTAMEIESSKYSTEKQQNDVEISIVEVYLQLLYARESIKNNENIVASSKVQLDQAEDFLELGKITQAEYAQVDAQHSSDNYNLVLSQNSFDTYKLQLKQLLELGIDESIEVDFPTISESDVVAIIPSKDEVYMQALNIMPEIKQSEKRIVIAELSKSTAKAAFLPTVSLQGNLGTSNTWNKGYNTFSTQIGRNFNQYVGVSISIPIFDNLQNKTSYKKAKLDIETAKLDYIDSSKSLLKTIENLYQDAVGAQSRLRAAKVKLESLSLSYDLIKEQYALGMRNTVELTTEQTNYSNALQDLLQAKYAALLTNKLLQFYQGKEISL